MKLEAFLDPIALKVTSGASALASGTSVVVLRDTVQAWHVPVPELLAAFSGAALILSFLPPRLDKEGNLVGRARTLGTIIFCTVLGTLLGPILGKAIDLFSGTSMAAAFVVAAVGQVAIPVLIDRKAEIVNWLAGLLPGRKGE